jgi:hypothetical protein
MALLLSTPPEMGFAAGGVELETVGEEFETGGLLLEAGGVGSGAGFGGGVGSAALTVSLSFLMTGSSTLATVTTLLPVSGSSLVSEGPRLVRAGALPDAFCTALFEATGVRLSVLDKSV